MIPPTGAAAFGEVGAAGLGAGTVVTWTPKYCASQDAVAEYLPPLLSTTWVVGLSRVLPPSPATRPASVSSVAQRFDAPWLRPLPSCTEIGACWEMVDGGTKRFWTKCWTVPKLRS